MTAPWTDAENKFLLLLADNKCTAAEISDGLAASGCPRRNSNDIIAKLAELRAEQAA